MTEEKQIYKIVEKQMQAANGVPFKVLDIKPREYWGSNYAYWLRQKKNGDSQRPLLCRKPDSIGEKEIQIYEDGEWVTMHMWDDLSEPMTDKEGNPVMKDNGKQRQQLLVENRKEILVEFESPIPVEFYDKETKSKITEEHQVVYVRMSNSLNGKLQEQLEDPRNTLDNSYEIKYDKTKSPAEQYRVVFVK